MMPPFSIRENAWIVIDRRLKGPGKAINFTTAARSALECGMKYRFALSNGAETGE
jgi:hypothetical protein